MNNLTARVASGTAFIAWSQRVVALTAMWWAIAEAPADGWYFAMPVVAAIAAFHAAAGDWRPWRPRWSAWLRFAVFFLEQTVRGGIDVAFRALHPRLPIAPGFIEMPLRLPEGPAQLLLINVISLLPGTLAISTDGPLLQLHVIDSTLPVHRSVHRLEHRIAALYGLTLADVLDE